MMRGKQRHEPPTRKPSQRHVIQITHLFFGDHLEPFDPCRLILFRQVHGCGLQQVQFCDLGHDLAGALR